MPPTSSNYDVIAIGGGPAGSALARVLAMCGHRVLLLARTIDRSRGLAESIPPSARKLLTAIDVLDAVEGAAFTPNRGNVVWWGRTARRVEAFSGTGDESGFQVFRPDLDELLLARAAAAGVDVRRGAIARMVEYPSADRADVHYEHAGERRLAVAHFAADCSGRAGVIARRGLRRYEPAHRMQAYVGMWSRPGWPVEGNDRTIVETYEDGWAWSLAISPSVRQVAVMVDAATTRTTRGPTFGDAYVAELAKTRQLRALTTGARLEHAWACDASLYSAAAFHGTQFILVGDAGACIDPLSSFGVKKALASAWLGAVALHTSLIDSRRRRVALEFFSSREREVYAADLARTRRYAAHAQEHHASEFWARRAGASDDEPLDDTVHLLRSPAVLAAHAELRASPTVTVKWGNNLRFERQPVVRGREIVLEDAVALRAGPRRFVAGVDLTALLGPALRPRRIPELFGDYCRRHGAVSLVHFLGAVSLLLAEGALESHAADASLTSDVSVAG
jgi:flavin-dependent dehydrogenase